MAFDPSEQLRDGAHGAGWDDADLWLAAVALGANLDLGEVAQITAGRRSPTAGEYDVLVAAINDHFTVVGSTRRISSWRESSEKFT